MKTTQRERSSWLSAKWIQTAALLAISVLVMLEPAPARAQGSSQTEQCFAVCGARKWWLAHRSEVRENSTCCLAWLEKAAKKEKKALRYYELARDPQLETWEQLDYLRLGNKMIAQRTKFLLKFRDCVNGVIHALAMHDQGFDATGLLDEACGADASCSLEGVLDD